MRVFRKNNQSFTVVCKQINRFVIPTKEGTVSRKRNTSK